jgi:hypothetical protein
MWLVYPSQDKILVVLPPNNTFQPISVKLKIRRSFSYPSFTPPTLSRKSFILAVRVRAKKIITLTEKIQEYSKIPEVACGDSSSFLHLVFFLQGLHAFFYLPEASKTKPAIKKCLSLLRPSRQGHYPFFN